MPRAETGVHPPPRARRRHRAPHEPPRHRREGAPRRPSPAPHRRGARAPHRLLLALPDLPRRRHPRAGARHRARAARERVARGGHRGGAPRARAARAPAGARTALRGALGERGVDERRRGGRGVGRGGDVVGEGVLLLRAETVRVGGALLWKRVG